MKYGARSIVPHRHQVKEKGILRVRQNTKGYASPMTTIPELAETMQQLLTTTADEVAKKRALSKGSAK